MKHTGVDEHEWHCDKINFGWTCVFWFIATFGNIEKYLPSKITVCEKIQTWNNLVAFTALSNLSFCEGVVDQPFQSLIKLKTNMI